MEEVKQRTTEEIRAEAEAYVVQKNIELETTPYYVCADTAKRLIAFVSMLKHTGGALAGVSFQLLHFQIVFLIDVICTKHRSTGRRRYTTALLFIPRKNGKTELIAALLNYFLFIDEEKGKEIYCAANETQQAQIIYKAASTMIKQNKTLEKRCNKWASTKTIEKKSGEFEDFIKVLTANAETKDGLKPYVVVYDELHAAKDASLYTVLEEGMASRDDPLFIIISTAGYNQQGIMKKKHDYAHKVQKGIVKDDTFYSMMFEIPPEELEKDPELWKKEATWRMVNPAMGYGAKISYFRSKFIKALESGEDEVAFKTKHLNIWTNAAKVWIRDVVWMSSNVYPLSLDDLSGRKCYGGLDLSSTTDITSLILVFPRDDGGLDVLRRYWIPEDNMRERARRDRVPYIDWHRDGHISTSNGNVIDYDFIEAEIIKLSEIVQIEILHYDRWNAANITNHLTDYGINAVGFGQGFASMSAPTKMIETLALQKKINHENDPVLRWMCSNVAITKDAADNYKIDKAKSRERVDGMVALAMAIGAWMTNTPKEESSPYESYGVRFL